MIKKIQLTVNIFITLVSLGLIIATTALVIWRDYNPVNNTQLNHTDSIFNVIYFAKYGRT